MNLVETLIVIIYLLALLGLFLFSLGQLNLVLHYLKSLREKEIVPVIKDFPPVTIQLPIYNERYVAERLIKAATAIDYPGKFEIQVLDDSDDETRKLISDLVKSHREEGIDIKHITRDDRNGFKAGALQFGLPQASGDLIAIFDADFIPNQDYLLNTVPYFINHEIGMVQTRWDHLNENYSVLTQIQAFGLNAHFSIEQKGRNQAGSYINFNGTGGIWRKACILDAGGWSADTLTEDLDLSYRAQAKGWKFKFLEQVESPGELPVLMSAIKTQQFRWNKGAAENARKNLGEALHSGLKIRNKIHALFHLLNCMVFPLVLIAGILSVPMLIIKDLHPFLNWFFHLGSFFLIGFFSIAYFYWVAAKQNPGTNAITYYLHMFPKFLTVIMGLSLHNSIAVMEGLFKIKSSFIRTPKFNVFNKTDSWKGNVYVKRTLDRVTLFEGLLGAYFVFALALGIYFDDFGLMFFHLLLALGFLTVFIYSVKHARDASV